MNIYRNKINQDIIKTSFSIIDEMHLKMEERSWNCNIKTSYNLTDNILNIQELWNLKFEILNNIYQYMIQTGKFFDGFVKNSWVNVYEKGFYQEFHNHKDDIVKHICGVVYFTETSSAIEFGIDDRITHQPEVGDILIFKDDDLHRVLPQQGDNKRISLAFNYKLTAIWKGIK